MDRWTGGTRSDYADLWIIVPLAALVSLLALCLVLPVLLHRYCRECMKMDACCGPYFNMFERMLGGRRARYSQRQNNEMVPMGYYNEEIKQEPAPVQQVYYYDPSQPPQQQQQHFYNQQQQQQPPHGVYNIQDYNQTHTAQFGSTSPHISFKAQAQKQESQREFAYHGHFPTTNPDGISYPGDPSTQGSIPQQVFYRQQSTEHKHEFMHTAHAPTTTQYAYYQFPQQQPQQQQYNNNNHNTTQGQPPPQYYGPQQQQQQQQQQQPPPYGQQYTQQPQPQQYTQQPQQQYNTGYTSYY